MPELPDPGEYEDVEAWMAAAMSTTELDGEAMDEIVEQLGRSRWVE